MLRSNLEKLSLELHCAHEKVDTLQKEIIYLSKEREDLLLQIRESEKESGQSNDLKVSAFVCLVAELTFVEKN